VEVQGQRFVRMTIGLGELAAILRLAEIARELDCRGIGGVAGSWPVVFL
jgi:hypothetical protein